MIVVGDRGLRLTGSIRHILSVAQGFLEVLFIFKENMMPIYDRQQRANLDQLVQDFVDYKANRRQFLQRAMAIGLSASAATALLQAC